MENLYSELQNTTENIIRKIIKAADDEMQNEHTFDGILKSALAYAKTIQEFQKIYINGNEEENNNKNEFLSLVELEMENNPKAKKLLEQLENIIIK